MFVRPRMYACAPSAVTRFCVKYISTFSSLRTPVLLVCEDGDAVS